MSSLRNILKSSPTLKHSDSTSSSVNGEEFIPESRLELSCHSKEEIAGDILHDMQDGWADFRKSCDALAVRVAQDTDKQRWLDEEERIKREIGEQIRRISF